MASDPYISQRLYNRDARPPARRSEYARLLVLEEPPGIDAGEITDKGYLNQRAILARRAADVARLYGDDPAVILPSPAASAS